jgi:hypothetical protein
MTEEDGMTFFALDTLFDHHTSRVFLDDYGHVTEAANARVAARLADIIAPKLEGDSLSVQSHPVGSK